MKFCINILLVLIIALQSNNVLASESITGIWQGKLLTGTDSDVTVQFIINKDAADSYSVILNSPDEGAIKNVKANSVVYDSGTLKLDVDELSGAYEGIVKNGIIEGKWNQEGTSFSLSLSPYQKPTLTREDMDKLLGQWHGHLVILAASLTAVFRFEMTEKNEFTGFFDLPGQGTSGIPITEMEMRDGIFTFKMSSIQAEYKGKLFDNEIVGDFSQGSTPFPLSLKKKE